MSIPKQKQLRAALLAGDCAATLAILDAAPPVNKKAGTAKRPKGRKFAPTPVLLGAAPCGCGVWLDTAVMCAPCADARDEKVIRALIGTHEAAIREYEARVFPTKPGQPCPGVSSPRNWSAFIFQAACRYKDCKVA